MQYGSLTVSLLRMMLNWQRNVNLLDELLIQSDLLLFQYKLMSWCCLCYVFGGSAFCTTSNTHTLHGATTRWYVLYVCKKVATWQPRKSWSLYSFLMKRKFRKIKTYRHSELYLLCSYVFTFLNFLFIKKLYMHKGVSTPAHIVCVTG